MTQQLITMSRLGTAGEFGNQIIQYAFIRSYARKWHIDYQLPPWVGQSLFLPANDDPITEILPLKQERYLSANEPRFGIPIHPRDDEYVGHDFHGWAQYHTSWYDRAYVQNLFTIDDIPQEHYSHYLDKLYKRGKTIISLHLRRGGNGRFIYLLTPMVWCLKWLHENWNRFDDPVLFLACEEVEYAKHFAAYNPVLIEDLGFKYDDVPPAGYTYPYEQSQFYKRQMNFFGDWFLLRHSDVVLTSESTYSFTAGWLNPNLQEMWWPRLSVGGFEQIDPWNSHMSPRELLNDYPGIPGTSLDENPKWDWDPNTNNFPAVPEDPEEILRWSQPPS